MILYIWYYIYDIIYMILYIWYYIYDIIYMILYIWYYIYIYMILYIYTYDTIYIYIASYIVRWVYYETHMAVIIYIYIYIYVYIKYNQILSNYTHRTIGDTHHSTHIIIGKSCICCPLNQRIQKESTGQHDVRCAAAWQFKQSRHGNV